MAKRIERVIVEHIPDDNTDLSHLGEYTNSPGYKNEAIDRKERGDMGKGEYRYFVPGMTGEETGNPDSPEQDYQRMENYNRGDWQMIGIRASAEIVVDGVCQTITSGGLWGIESDSGADYFSEVGRDELGQLRGLLAELGFSTKAIAKAMKACDPCGV